MNTTILMAFGELLGTAPGLVVAPLLVNAQRQASGLGWGIAVTPSVGALAVMLRLTVATAVALRHGDEAIVPPCSMLSQSL